MMNVRQLPLRGPAAEGMERQVQQLEVIEGTQFTTVAAVARYYGVSTDAVRTGIRRGELSARKLSNRVRIDVASALTWGADELAAIEDGEVPSEATTSPVGAADLPLTRTGMRTAIQSLE